jgi:large subunit ribosomal protein L9
MPKNLSPDNLSLHRRVKYNKKKDKTMKVIFLQDVPNVAKAGETKEVADGYGRNFLIPKKLALLASPSAVSTIEAQRKTKARNQKQIGAELVELADQLEGKEVILKVRVGAKDRLYGSITSADIAAELESTAGLAIDKRKIELAEPIRQLGSYEVAIRLASDILPKIKVTVTAKEKETTAEEKEVKTKEKEVKAKETE